MTAYLGIILGGAGIVFGVIALMVAAEMSRRVNNLIHYRFQQSEIELMKGLDNQDRELKRQRRLLAEALENIEHQFKTQNEKLKNLEARLDIHDKVLDEIRGVRRVIPTDEERGFTKREGESGFAQGAPFSPKSAIRS